MGHTEALFVRKHNDKCSNHSNNLGTVVMAGCLWVIHVLWVYMVHEKGEGWLRFYFLACTTLQV